MIGVNPSVEVWVQEVAPDSKPGFASSCAGVHVPPPDPVTVNEYEAVCEPEDAVPVTVTEYVPVGVVEAVAMVSVEDAPEVTEAGLKLAVAPDGRPDADSVTDSADPDVTAVPTDTVAEEPWLTDPDVGDAEIEKSSAGGGVDAEAGLQ